jgi:hypothetical protein
MEKMNASITSSKKELDYQLQYPGKNKVIKEYVNIRNFYSWGDKKDTVDTLTRNSYISPTIYDLRTPMKKGNQKKQTMKKLSCRLIDLQISKATKKEIRKNRQKRKSEKTDNEEIVLSSDQSSDFKSNKKGTAKRRTTLFLQSYISIGSTS